MLGRDIETDRLGYWGKDHSGTLDTLAKMPAAEKEGPLSHKNFFVGFDGLMGDLADYNAQVPEVLGQDLLNHRLNSVNESPDVAYEEPPPSFYGLMPCLDADLSVPAFPVPAELPVRLSSPIQLNLSTSMPNPTIEQLHSKKKGSISQSTVDSVGSVSGSPQTDSHGEASNAFGPLATRALSLSPVSSDAAAKKKSPSRSGSSSSGIKRPLNSFMLYRRDKQSSIPTNNHQSISRIIGEMWKRETIEEKERYTEMAQRERERHAKEYPDYKFLPRKKKDKNASGKSPRRRKTFDPSLEQDESKILRMMLSQISHKKSQSEAGKFKLDQYSWLVNGENNETKKATFDVACQTNTNHSQAGLAHTNQHSEMSFMPGIYTAPSSVPLPIFPMKDKVDKVDTHNSLDGYLALDNLGDYEFRSLVNNYSTSSVNDSRLGTSYNKSCTESPQSIALYDDIKNLDIFSKKKEASSVPVIPTFDSTVFQDDAGHSYDNFVGIWDDPVELSSFPSLPLDNHRVLGRTSLELLNTGLVGPSNTFSLGDNCRKY